MAHYLRGTDGPILRFCITTAEAYSTQGREGCICNESVREVEERVNEEGRDVYAMQSSREVGDSRSTQLL